MKDCYRGRLISLLILLLMLVTVDIYLRAMQQPNQRRCLAVPAKLVLQDPECAAKLLEAANVSSVRIMPANMTGTLR